MKKSINIMIAEDQRQFRELIADLLSKEDGIVPIALAPDGVELIKSMEKKQPDVVLLDIDMPNMNGKQALQIIKERFPKVRVIMLTQFVDDNLKADFYEKGADGFLSKNEELEIIARTIREVHQNTHAQDKINSKPRYTPMQVRIIPLLSKGMTVKDIARKLNISEDSAEGYRQRLYKYTGSTTRAEFTTYCVKHGLDFLG